MPRNENAGNIDTEKTLIQRGRTIFLFNKRIIWRFECLTLFIGRHFLSTSNNRLLTKAYVFAFYLGTTGAFILFHFNFLILLKHCLHSFSAFSLSPFLLRAKTLKKHVKFWFFFFKRYSFKSIRVKSYRKLICVLWKQTWSRRYGEGEGGGLIDIVEEALDMVRSSFPLFKFGVDFGTWFLGSGVSKRIWTLSGSDIRTAFDVDMAFS